jgi:PAS domain S-box-containing protein
MDFSLFDFVPDAILVVDRDGGRIVHVNAVAEELFGHPREALVGKPLDVLVPPSVRVDHRAHVAAYDAAPRRGPMRHGVDLYGLRRDGSEFQAEITLSPFSDGGRRYAVAAVRDVSDRKRLERSADLLRETQAALTERDAFLSTAAHELRTPVAALQLRLDFLHREADRSPAPVPPLDLANLEELERLTRRITIVVNSVIAVTQLRGGAIDLRVEEVDLADAARQVIGRLRTEIAKSGSEVRVDAPVAVVGRWDKTRVEQVLTNLLVNAIKFGEQKSIRVVVRGDEVRARLSVTDQGVGIAPEHHDRIFGAFETGQSDTTLPGLGLGLYVCGEIMNAHGGTIEVQSTPGVGSTFTVEFPREPAAPAGVRHHAPGSGTAPHSRRSSAR